MDETIAPIAGLGARSILVIGTKADMDALLAKIQVGEAHPQQLTKPKSAFFEHKANQPIAKACGISLWGTSIADCVHKGLELLRGNGEGSACWLFLAHFQPLCLEATP